MADRTIIIPDVHTRHEIVDKILRKDHYDRVISLGDLWDDFGDTVAKNEATARWFVECLEDPRITFIAGNHDLSYLSGIPQHRCSGWTPEKNVAINAIVKREHFAQMKLSVMEQGWLISHAGWHRDLLLQFGCLQMGPIRASEYAMEETLNGKFVALLGAGRSRGGSQEFGGITWCDWGEFKAHSDYKQILGHTPGGTVRMTQDGKNICLDTNSRHYVVLEEGKVEIKEA